MTELLKNVVTREILNDYCSQILFALNVNIMFFQIYMFKCICMLVFPHKSYLHSLDSQLGAASQLFKDPREDRNK